MANTRHATLQALSREDEFHGPIVDNGQVSDMMTEEGSEATRNISQEESNPQGLTQPHLQCEEGDHLIVKCGVMKCSNVATGCPKGR